MPGLPVWNSAASAIGDGATAAMTVRSAIRVHGSTPDAPAPRARGPLIILVVGLRATVLAEMGPVDFRSLLRRPRRFLNTGEVEMCCAIDICMPNRTAGVTASLTTYRQLQISIRLLPRPIPGCRRRQLGYPVAPGPLLPILHSVHCLATAYVAPGLKDCP